MTATTRHETPFLPPKNRSDTNRSFSWVVVLVPTSMNDSEERNDDPDGIGVVWGGATFSHPQIPLLPPKDRNDSGRGRGDGGCGRDDSGFV